MLFIAYIRRRLHDLCHRLKQYQVGVISCQIWMMDRPSLLALAVSDRQSLLALAVRIGSRPVDPGRPRTDQQAPPARR